METSMENAMIMLAEDVNAPALPVIAQAGSFDDVMKMANLLASSTIVPATYQRRPENCFIALEMANRMGVPFMMVAQNLYIVQGKPSWSGSAVASMVKSHPNLEDVELHYVGEPNTEKWGAYVTANSKKTGKELRGATVTIGIANAEGWIQKTGSKWKTFPELMLAYRAYAWFGRVHAPEIMMGLQSVDEVEDVGQKETSTVTNPYERKEV